MREKVEEARHEGKLSQAAHDNVMRWLAESKYAEYKDELEQLIEAGSWQTLEDSFFKVIPFGTGGRRGTVGIGPNRINKVTIGESAQGLADYVKTFGEENQAQGIVIARDTRLTSEEFTQFAAGVLAANGFKVYVFDSFRATPELSFAVRYLKAAAGVVISASHNPPSDNGFKVYWSDGGQIVPPHDTELMAAVSRVKNIAKQDYHGPATTGQIQIIGKEIDEAYIAAIVQESLTASRTASIIYSPLHGAGSSNIVPVLRQAGFANVSLVKSQTEPDGRFPNVKDNIPNPEVPTTSEAVIEQAKAQQADVGITTDPDADRLGVVARDERGHYRFLTGNQIAALIGFYVLDQMKQQGKLKPNHFLVKTIVTTDFLNALAEDFGVKIYNNILIGFKYVAELIRLKQDEGSEEFLFGGEESHGILKGSYTRDKDAAIAALMMAELVSNLKDQGKNIIWQLQDLYRRYGLFWETLTNIKYEGAEGFAKMTGIMSGLRAKPPAELAGRHIVAAVDRLDSKHGLIGDVLVFHLSNDGRSRITVRPSGTEPKLKIYAQVYQELPKTASDEAINQAKQASDEKAKGLVQAITEYFETL